MDFFFRDLRHALRALLKSPGFTAAVILTLALGIGANTAMFSLVNQALFAPLPYDGADRLVRLFSQTRDGQHTGFLSYPDYLEYRDRSEVFEQLVAFCYLPINVGVGDTSETRTGQVVTGDYFSALSVKARVGRLLSPEDNKKPGAHSVVVLNHRYWRNAYGGRPDVIGDTITISGNDFTIVGVAPEGFSGAMTVPSPDIWLPAMMLEQIRPEDRGALDSKSTDIFWPLGRLKHGLSMSQAQASLDVTASQLEAIDPDHYADQRMLLVPAKGIIPMLPGLRQSTATVAALIMAVVGLVLVVACANVANLLLARSTVRQKDLAIRLALGASRGRIIRQLLTESLLLAVLGGGVGLALALWAMDLLVLSLPQLPFNYTLDLNFTLDRRLLAFTSCLSLLSSALFGLLPALGSTRISLVPALKDLGGAGTVTLRRSRLRGALVVAQVAVSLVLLVGAGLFVRSLLRAQAMDPGFDHRNVLAVILDLGAHGYDRPAKSAFFEDLLKRTHALPGIESASIEDCPALTLAISRNEFWIEDREYADPEDARISLDTSTISANHFRTLRIPLLSGRVFSEQDTQDAPGVAVVNQAFVERYWPEQDPLGKRLSHRGPEGPFLEVIGVVPTIEYRLIGEAPRPYVYEALSQHPGAPIATLLVRTSGPPVAAIPAIRHVIRDLNPDMSLADARPLTDLIGFTLLPAKLAAGLFSLFGLLAMLLASIGLYGVMSYMVCQRTREIGIRTALGAQRGDILRLVLRRALMLTLVGLAIGLVIAFLGTRVFSAFLCGVTPTDPATFIVVSFLLMTVALLASYMPARRAAKVDPMVALRYE
ncbi:MAG: ABC transporter permease [Phycisphaerales bacterium]|nr:MAG: ABC transporter permease [Phycisphaerales bacterium]